MRNIIALLLSSLALSPASAEDTFQYATVKDWAVMVDKTIGGCFILGSYTQGEIFRIGFSRAWKNGYLMIANSAWHSVEEGKQYDLAFTFDNDPPWSGTFTGTKMGNSIALLNGFNNSKFLSAVAQKNLLTITYGNTIVTKLPLTGTYAAILSMMECQKKVDDILAGGSATDPFANGGRPPDPFSGGATAPRRAIPAASDPFKL